MKLLLPNLRRPCAPTCERAGFSTEGSLSGTVLLRLFFVATQTACFAPRAEAVTVAATQLTQPAMQEVTALRYYYMDSGPFENPRDVCDTPAVDRAIRQANPQPGFTYTITGIIVHYGATYCTWTYSHAGGSGSWQEPVFGQFPFCPDGSTRGSVPGDFCGYTCPNGYVLAVSTCTRYTCPPGSYSLDAGGTTCSQPGGASDSDKNAGTCPSSGPMAGNPINVGTGNKVLAETDYRASNAASLEWHRTYNYLIVRSGGPAFSTRWTHSYSRWIVVVSGTSTAYLFKADGRVVKAQLFNSTINDGEQTWTLDAYATDRLIRRFDAGNQPIGWKVINGSDRSSETYDASGRLVTITNRGADTQSLFYSDGTAAGGYILDAEGSPTISISPVGLLVRVVDSLGRRACQNFCV